MQIGSFWRGQAIPMTTGSGSEKTTKLVTAASEANGGPSRADVVDELLLSDASELPRMSDMSARSLHGRKLLEETLEKPWSPEQYQQKRTALQARITDRLHQIGIENTDDIRLTMDSSGYVVSLGGHPRKNEIEQIFRDEPGLRNDFAQVSGQGSLLKAAEEAIKFQTAYLEDPLQALAQFAYLFERNGPPPEVLDLKPESEPASSEPAAQG